MANTAGVGNRAQKVQGVYGTTVSIQNVGPDDVYLGSDGSVTADNGWLLPARGMGTWEGGTELWAISAGQSALRIADSALSYFTPGPDHVTVDGGTVMIGNASIPITGSVDIASGTVQASISGPVTINGGTVQVGGSVTATADVVNLYSDTATVNTVPTGGLVLYDSGASGAIVRQYRTLVMTFGGIAMSGCDASQSIQIRVQQYNGSTLIADDYPQMLGTGMMRYRTAIVAPRVIVRAYGLGGSSSLLRGVQINATTADMPHFYHQQPGSSAYVDGITSGAIDGNVLNRFLNFRGTVPAGGNGSFFASSLGGPIRAMWSAPLGSGTDMVYNIVDVNTGGSIVTSVPVHLVGAAGGTRNQLVDAILPESPIQLTVSNPTSTAGALTTAISFQGVT